MEASCCVLSISPVSNFSCSRNLRSSPAISPLSRSWSKPARWRIPCSVRIFISVATECPRRLALSRAISAETARSPASCFALARFIRGSGNDNTSVGLSFPRNRKLSERSSWLLVTSTFTVPRKRTARLARNKKRSSVDGLSPAILFRRITNFYLRGFYSPYASRGLTSDGGEFLTSGLRKPPPEISAFLPPDKSSICCSAT